MNTALVQGQDGKSNNRSEISLEKLEKYSGYANSPDRKAQQGLIRVQLRGYVGVGDIPLQKGSIPSGDMKTAVRVVPRNGTVEMREKWMRIWAFGITPYGDAGAMWQRSVRELQHRKLRCSTWGKESVGTEIHSRSGCAFPHQSIGEGSSPGDWSFRDEILSFNTDCSPCITVVLTMETCE